MNVFVGVIVLLFGSLLALLGGGCTIMVSSMGMNGADWQSGLLLGGISLATLAGGLALVKVGYEIMGANPKALSQEAARHHLDEIERQRIAEIERERGKNNEPPRS